MEMQVAAAPPAEGLFAPRYRAPTLGAVALIALHAFEALAITTAMPTAAQSLDGLPLYALAFAATLASSVVGMVACGRWADRRGPHAPLTHGIVWFSIGLLVAGLAPSMAVLLLGRVVQGFGGGLMSVALYVAVGRVYPPALRVRVFAAFAGAWVVPAIVGPTISGLIVEHLGWRWVFLLVPVVAVLAATMVLPALRAITPLPDPMDEAGAASRERHRLAWAIAAAASALLLHWGGQQRGWLAALVLVLAAVALLICMHRLLPRGTLSAARGLPTVIAMRGIVASVFYGTEVFLPLLLSRERGLSPTMAGAALTIGAVGWSAGSWYRGRMVDPSPARVVQTGMALLTLGLAVATLAVFPTMPLAFALVGWVIAGVGVGTVFPSISALTLELSPPAQQGVNSSALHLSDALFTATVLAVVGSLFSALLEHSPMAAYLCGFAITTALAAIGTAVGGRVRPAATL
ncbi:MFS transporter [Montanilutibacter psychrotolerans]|uniref:MFS transporter n=1 Tax=Montanilutibacter psychrotolerans TaxID=1327343 RepID=A0A3M8STF8_9GAMM|nr:MFS transporter [Lysobacter psychrotolerans]RNF82042.1 MFS transporter [Lysobacter psychrotolerans]